MRPGERVLIAGESGCGKSSLIRAIAGCWPWCAGEILHGRDQRIMVVPQRPYVPAGTLRQALTYPLEVDQVNADRAAAALTLVGLGELEAQLDTPAAWANILSAGEQQRLAIARLLLHRPEIVALDEATSALHVAGQAELMDVLARELPGAIIISVGHRPELEQFHQRKLVIARGPHGARIVWDGEIVNRGGRINPARVDAPALQLDRALLVEERCSTG
jgi:putative ATP-binding cassette transporter